MAAHKGHKKEGGRKRGTVNKNTKAMREMALAALDTAGGEKYLVRISKSDPKAFLGFIGKFVPAEIKAQLEHTGVPSVEIRDYTGAVIAALEKAKDRDG